MRKRRSLPALLALGLLSAPALVAGPARADADDVWLVSGTVRTAAGAPVEGAVASLAPAGGAVVAEDTADGAGAFEMSAPSGTYDLTVTPPAGSGLQTAVIRDLVVDRDRTVNVVLAPASSKVWFRGVLRTRGGEPIQDAIVTVGNRLEGHTAETAADGSFALNVTAGEYYLQVHDGWPPPTDPDVPDSFWATVNSVSLTTDVVQDLTLPTVSVTVRALDPEGAPVPGSEVSPSGSFVVGQAELYPGAMASVQAGDVATTGDDGRGRLTLVSSPDAAFKAVPPDGIGLGTGTVQDVDATTDVEVAVTMPAAVVYQGTVRDRAGTGLPGLTVALKDPFGPVGDSATTDGTGHFALEIPPGLYDLTVDGAAAARQTMPYIFYARVPDLEIETGFTKDLTFSTVFFDVTVRNTAGTPLGGVPLRSQPPAAHLRTMELADGWTAYVGYYDQGATDGAGQDRVVAFPGEPVSVFAEPAPSSGYGVLRLYDVDATADHPLEMVLPTAGAAVRGTIRLEDGSPASGVTFSLGNVGISTTGVDGTYSVQAPAGTYGWGLSSYGIPSPQVVPNYFSIGSSTVTLGDTDVVKDLTIDPAVLSVTVQDPAGNPVSGVVLTTNMVQVATEVDGVAFTGEAYERSTTGSLGTAEVGLFPMREDSPPLSLTVTPPAWSNLGTVRLEGLRVTGDDSLTVVLSSLSGALSEEDGAGIPGQTVSLEPASTGARTSATTVSTTTGVGGAFALSAPKGVYRLGVSSPSGDGEDVPASYDIDVPSFDLNQPRQQDLSLPVVTLDVTVRTAGGQPVPAAEVEVPCAATSFELFPGGAASGEVCGQGTTDGTGTARVALLPMASFSLVVTPPTASGLRATTVDDLSIAGDSTRQVTVLAEGPVRRLTVTKAGLGSGTVTSSPVGIACGDACSATFAQGRSVTLTAAPGSFSSFTGWTGACSGAARTCTLSMSVARSVTATFAKVPSFLLEVTETGSGSVTSSPVGIACPSDCVQRYRKGAVVVLTAKPASGWRFVKWQGGCATPASKTCTVTMSGPQARTAIFKPA